MIELLHIIKKFRDIAGQTDRPTDRPTDHATRSVTIDRIYVRSTAMRSNNSQLCKFLQCRA